MKKSAPVLSFFLAALCSIAAALPAEIRAVRTDKGPRIDGDLTDPEWQAAAVFAGFRMVEPTPNADPTEKTELRILFDEANLYIGVFCADSAPGLISATTKAHDSGGGGSGGYHMYGGFAQGSGDDLVRVLIDPFQDKRTAYVFYVNPHGARSEGLAYAGDASLDWDGIWEARCSTSDAGWSAEIKIPFKTISFKPGLSVWGINVERVIARKRETIRLSGTTRDANFENPMEAASLAGIDGIKQGKGITFRPYGLGLVQEGSGKSLSGDAGFDLYKNFTPNLVGAVSYNMDFAETEVDERRINLTRFNLYFPEKRMFFLEGSEVFSFGSSVSFMPFFSRRIGLLNGEQIPVLFGTKLYGKVGDMNLAVLDVQTGKDGNVSGHNLFAARVTRNIFSQSRVGLILTNGSPTGGRNTLAGMDLRLSSSTFLGNKNIMASAWAVYNWNETTGGGHQGFGFRADYPNDLWDIQTTYAYYGKALDPGLGYMMRPNVQTAFARVSYQPRPVRGLPGKTVRQFYFSLTADYYWDLDGALETRTLTLSPLSFSTHSGETFGLYVNGNRDILPYDFEIAEGVVLHPKPYDYTNFTAFLSTASHRRVSFNLSHTFGEFYSGHLDETRLGVSLRVGSTVNLSLSTDLIRGRLLEGRFNENVYEVKADFFATPDLGFMNYIQYDSVSKELGWSARIRWRVSPGNDIYLVYNKNWERTWDPRSRFIPKEGRGVFKITLSIRP